jgi:hypothetical protein
MIGDKPRAHAVEFSPAVSTGIPDSAQRCATEIGCPRKAAICCQPFSESGSGFRGDSSDFFAIGLPLRVRC